MPFNLGWSEIMMVLVLALVFVGPKKLPELASGLGKMIREFRKATAGIKDEIQLDEHIRKPFEELREAVTLPADELRRRDQWKAEWAKREAEEKAQAEKGNVDGDEDHHDDYHEDGYNHEDPDHDGHRDGHADGHHAGDTALSAGGSDDADGSTLGHSPAPPAQSTSPAAAVAEEKPKLSFGAAKVLQSDKTIASALPPAAMPVANQGAADKTIVSDKTQMGTAATPPLPGIPKGPGAPPKGAVAVPRRPIASPPPPPPPHPAWVAANGPSDDDDTGKPTTTAASVRDRVASVAPARRPTPPPPPPSASRLPAPAAGARAVPTPDKKS